MMTTHDLSLTWDLNSVLSDASEDSVTRELSAVRQAFGDFTGKWKDRTDYLNEVPALKEALDEYEHLFATMGLNGRPGYYFWLKQQLDQTDPEIKAKVSKTDDLAHQLFNESQFFTHRLSKVPYESQLLFLNDPRLADYRYFLESLFAQAKYLLSENEEKILSLKSDTSYTNWVNMTSDFLSREERNVLTPGGKSEMKSFAEIQELTVDKDQQVRDSAYKAYLEIIGKHANVAEVEINSILKDKKVNDELKGLPRPDTATHLIDSVDTEVVDTLIQRVSARYDISRRFYELKAKLMGKKQLMYNEKSVEYGDVDRSFTYPQAVDVVSKVFKRLDPQFVSIFSDYTTHGKIDVMPKKGKVSGAFCVASIKDFPGFVLLNFTGNIRDVTTLAHEMGHAINYELMRVQNALNFLSSTFTAEVASTFMEDFVVEEISKESGGDETRLAVNMMRLNDSISAIQRQIAFYTFEQELHKKFREKGYLSGNEINTMFAGHMKEYLGDAVDVSAGAENTWISWSHLRMFFYVYSYAGGYLISKSLQASVRADPSFIGKVKEFLAAGSSASAKDIFKELGIDISEGAFWDKGLDQMSAELDETYELAKKLGKI